MLRISFVSIAALAVVCASPLRADVKNAWVGVNGATCPT